ncbi:hypothetical protein GOHSU_20_00040 [Gordonia hirsuta DSM 44140 = NBRC 16056]|uniref:Uncharacterized protein n=1 Tax=Gordonia hirsuta DSM 44140 = NBRC 16056 TaxID=1121927 RepID=L7LBP4_9ACTN|nr:hypothetical protein GOHSU_20_00040 [Gordonia hirsuta DSM 44140 = NBRC 16056]
MPTVLTPEGKKALRGAPYSDGFFGRFELFVRIGELVVGLRFAHRGPGLSLRLGPHASFLFLDLVLLVLLERALP